MPKIVVVDDDRDILEATAELLRNAGHEVRTVQKAADALQVLREHRPELLLQDCAMPGLDLDRLVDDIRRDKTLQGVAILLFTGAVDVRDTAAHLPVEGFIEKPFDFDQLMIKVHRALASDRRRPVR